MRSSLSFALIVFLFWLAGCGCDSSAPRYRPEPLQRTQDAMQNREEPSARQTEVSLPAPRRPPTPEEELGIESPGKLAASVEAWIGSNEFHDYFKQSRVRLAQLHAQLIEDYNVRKESELAANEFTNELLRKYHEAFIADEILRKHMVECYSRREVRPLPQSISPWFTTAGEDREWIRSFITKAPMEIDRLTVELAALTNEFKGVGGVTWTQEKELGEWRDIQMRLTGLATRANKTNADTAALSSNMEKILLATENVKGVDGLNDKAEHLKSVTSAFVNSLAQQLEIVKGQMLLTKFADDCKLMSEGMTEIPEAFAGKTARLRKINELQQRLRSSYVRGYSDLNELEQQVAAIKERSRKAAASETELGNRVQKAAGNYERVFGASAINLLKWKLPEPAARARIDANLSAFRRAANIPAGSDPRGPMAALESKAFQLADRMEEDAMLRRLDETLLATKRLAASRR